LTEDRNVQHYDGVTTSNQDGTEYPRRPLVGLKIIDMTTSYAGPTASMYLADLGADVIKVERPGVGDEARGLGARRSWGNASAWFASANRNKRSVVVNLRDPRGRAALRRLIGSADVFMENLNPGKLATLGIDYETISAEYPRVIYCAMSGFGLNGPGPGTARLRPGRAGSLRDHVGDRCPRRLAAARFPPRYPT